jgi:hypothetical protein
VPRRAQGGNLPSGPATPENGSPCRTNAEESGGDLQSRRSSSWGELGRTCRPSTINATAAVLSNDKQRGVAMNFYRQEAVKHRRRRQLVIWNSTSCHLRNISMESQ